jgi:RNA polymerase sigma factor (sigma-70 family)
VANNKTYTEEQLVSLITMRDQQAFGYLYDNYAPALLGIIYKMVDDRQISEDILQEAFVKIWNNFNSYSSAKGRLFTWMINLTRNLTIDTLRSKGYKKQQKISTDENSVDTYADGSVGAASFDALGIRKQLVNLKNDQKQVIELAYFSCMTQDEISKELKIPLGTVKTRIRSALLELRKMLQYFL